jgi:hypothetical protein
MIDAEAPGLNRPNAKFWDEPRRMTIRPTLILCGLVLLAACAKEPPPRSVTEFMENEILLEAAIVRCSQDRSATRYDAECVNAREAVQRIQAKEEAERREELEQRSERKREALRRTQHAAAEARRRAAEAERLRKEAEYLAQFGVLPSEDDLAEDEATTGNLPGAVVPQAPEPGSLDSGQDIAPATDGGNAPVSDGDSEPGSDLDAIREELRRRNEAGANED